MQFKSSLFALYQQTSAHNHKTGCAKIVATHAQGLLFVYISQACLHQVDQFTFKDCKMRFVLNQSDKTRQIVHNCIFEPCTAAHGTRTNSPRTSTNSLGAQIACLYKPGKLDQTHIKKRLNLINWAHKPPLVIGKQEHEIGRNVLNMVGTTDRAHIIL